MKKLTKKLLLCAAMSLLLFTVSAYSQNKQSAVEISLKHSGDTNEIATKN